MKFLALFSVIVAGSALAQNFVQSPAIRERILTEANELPVYYTVVDESLAQLPTAQEARMIPFVHPASQGAAQKAGLRLMPVSRKTIQATLGSMLQDGDIVLSFRAEWAGGGAYTSVQMGVSHAGIIYKDGASLANVDAPLNTEYVGKLDSKHYKETRILHVVRPRNLTTSQRTNLSLWSKNLVQKRASIYPSKIAFNTDYGAPTFDPNASSPLTFVKAIGAHAIGINAPVQSVFCSELAWAVLSLRNCHPINDRAQFEAVGTPKCISPIFQPMRALGDFAQTNADDADAGLADGPLLVLKAIDPTTADAGKIIRDMFTPTQNSRMSQGHRDVAAAFAPLFAPLENYYKNYLSNAPEVVGLKAVFNQRMKRNYSPTAFLVNTLLPVNNKNRVFDYVATIVFVD